MVVLRFPQVGKVPYSHLIPSLSLNYKPKLGKNQINISVNVYLYLHREREKKKIDQNVVSSYAPFLFSCLFFPGFLKTMGVHYFIIRQMLM